MSAPRTYRIEQRGTQTWFQQVHYHCERRRVPTEFSNARILNDLKGSSLVSAIYNYFLFVSTGTRALSLGDWDGVTVLHFANLRLEPNDSKATWIHGSHQLILQSSLSHWTNEACGNLLQRSQPRSLHVNGRYLSELWHSRC